MIGKHDWECVPNPAQISAAFGFPNAFIENPKSRSGNPR